MLVVLLAALVAPAAAQVRPSFRPGRAPSSRRRPTPTRSSPRRCSSIRRATRRRDHQLRGLPQDRSEQRRRALEPRRGLRPPRAARRRRRPSTARRWPSIRRSPTFRFNLALALYKGGRYAEAVTELQGVLVDAAPRHLQARLLLGDCYLRQGRFQDVVDLLAPWEASYGGDRGFAYVLGSAFIETDRVDHGQRLIEHHLQGRRERRRAPADGDRCTCAPAMRRRRWSSCARRSSSTRSCPVANGLLGRALLRNGEHEAALRAFLRELEINPDDFNTNLQVGELKKRDQQFDEARRLHRARAADAPGRRRRPLRARRRLRLHRQERGGAAAARGRRRGRAEVLGGRARSSRWSTTACSGRPTAIACGRASRS